MDLIIAEKPSVAKSIADILGANNKCDGYFEGKGFYITFAFGHLYNLCDVVEYNPEYKNWKLEHYPFIPETFKYKAINNPGVKKQIKIIKELVDKSNNIICATDADREGELIFAEIKNNLNIKKPIKRLWITAHTPKDIEKGMNNLKENMSLLESAGYCRQWIDWIIGINLTTIFTLKAAENLKNEKSITLKVGRVILPTLKLIYDREIEIYNFKSKPFYSLKVEFNKDDNSYTSTYIDDKNNSKFDDKSILQEIINTVKNTPGIVLSKTSKESRVNAPKLFSLTDLQGYITSKYNSFTSDKVLNVLQSLYENKYVTYPRTASRYLNDTQIDEAKESLNTILPLFNVTSKVEFHTNKSVFNSSKVDSHPAIIPTYIAPNLDKLSQDENIIYTEIAKRFLSQFMNPAIYENIEIKTSIDHYIFITKGKNLISLGWKELYTNTKELEDNEDEEDKLSIKNLNENDKVTINTIDIKEGKTVPPAHYNESSLLSAMENCGKNIDSEEDILKGFTIGTPATRADTIKKLIDLGYIIKKGKSLLITNIGLKVINYFPIKKLLSVNFTGKIEKTLKDIEKGEYDSKEFMSKMNTYIIKQIEDMKNSSIKPIGIELTIIGKCPNCGKSIVENSKAYSCENKSCNFVLFKEDKFFKAFDKKITKSIAESLIKNGAAKVKGLKSKKGTKFDATIKLKKSDNGYWNFELLFDNKKKK